MLEAPVRDEHATDAGAVRKVNASAFGRPDEARLVDALRAAARPLVSLVAGDAERVVGHVLFTPVTLEGYPGIVMGLAPVAVLPDRQRRGIGSALVRAGLERCRQIGAVAVVVLGHPELYRRFGFVPAAHFRLGCEYHVAPEAFMALELRADALRGTGGTVRYHPAFAGL